MSWEIYSNIFGSIIIHGEILLFAMGISIYCIWDDQIRTLGHYSRYQGQGHRRLNVDEC